MTETLVVCGLVVACSSCSLGYPAPGAVDSSQRDSSSTSPLRLACDEPSLEIDPTADVPGFQHVDCHRPATEVVVFPTETWLRSRPSRARYDTVRAFVSANRDALVALGDVKSAEAFGCCGRRDGDACVALWIGPCGPKTARVASTVLHLWQAAGFPDEAMGIQILRTGRLGPRCQASDAACTPESYDPEFDTKPYDPEKRRYPVRELRGDACTHDGDCLGAGNSCEAWTKPSYFGSLLRLKMLEDAFCGCVAGHCSWFTQ